jgi:hypothetical protein
LLDTGKAWRPALSFDTALDHSTGWIRRVELYLNLGDGAVGDMWLQPGSVDGYEFVPLTTAMAISEEANVMRHCVVDYGEIVAEGRSRVWSVRRDGARVATLEAGFLGDDPYPCIIQMNGADNAMAAPEVWLAARRWLNGHELPSLGRKATPLDMEPLAREGWFRVWRPYWLAKRRIPHWLPLSPSRAALGELRYGRSRRRRYRMRRR